MKSTILRLLALLLAAVLVAGACSSDEGGNSDDTEQTDSEGEANDGGDGESAAGVPAECEVDEGEGDSAAAEVEDRGAPDPSVAEEVSGDDPVDLIEGEGDEVNPGGTAEIHYVIINPADGSELESSWAMGQTVPVPVNQTFERFGQALEGMKVGGRRAFTVSASDAAGGAPPEETGIGADDDLVFVVDLVSVSDEVESSTAETDPDALAAAEERGAPDVAAPEGTVETEELVVIDDVVGDGQIVCPGDTVVAHYTGVTAVDSEQFDSSWDRGAPIDFSLDGVIQGWSDGLVGMKVGGRRTLVIPTQQAYDNEPGQPEGVLVFTVDLVGVG